MLSSKFTSASPGTLVDALDALGGQGKAFCPDPLPPKLDLLRNMKLRLLVSQADRELARLDGLARQFDKPGELFRNYLRREAVLSSKIEGTHTSITDLLLFEATREKRVLDEPAVENYVRAHDYGWERVGEVGISLQLLLELHKILFDETDSARTCPGRLRDCMAFIGKPNFQDARFVPPPELFVRELLENLTSYFKEELELPLVKLAVGHYQFETIHPFRDGNGRVGRLLVPLFLRNEGILSEPMLYLSAYFDRNQQAYYDQLLNVSLNGAWEEWLEFFFLGIIEQSKDAQIRTNTLIELRKNYKIRLAGPRTSQASNRLVDQLFTDPVISVPQAKQLLDVTYPAARAAIEKLIQADILAGAPVVIRGTGYFIAQELIRNLESPVT